MSTRPWNHLIRSGDLNLGWPPLYAATFGLEFLTGWLRALVAALVLLIANLFTAWWFGLRLPVNTLALIIGFAPLPVSLATLVLPLGGWVWQQAEGGRAPSERERAVFELAFAQLKEADPGLRAPGRWFVLDSPEGNAAAYANALMVTRGLLDSQGLVPVLAHELGHLNSSDARVTAAVHRLVIPPHSPEEPVFPIVGRILGGRAALDLMSIPWGIYWRRRERVADAYAARLGLGPGLAEFLDGAVDRPTPFKSLGGSSHPWTEHRVEDLDRDEE
jgi:Zn-dependent protease with chaperone function